MERQHVVTGFRSLLWVPLVGTLLMVLVDAMVVLSSAIAFLVVWCAVAPGEEPAA